MQSLFFARLPSREPAIYALPILIGRGSRRATRSPQIRMRHLSTFPPIQVFHLHHPHRVSLNPHAARGFHIPLRNVTCVTCHGYSAFRFRSFILLSDWHAVICAAHHASPSTSYFSTRNGIYFHLSNVPRRALGGHIDHLERNRRFRRRRGLDETSPACRTDLTSCTG